MTISGKAEAADASGTTAPSLFSDRALFDVEQLFVKILFSKMKWNLSRKIFLSFGGSATFLFIFDFLLWVAGGL